MQGPAGQSPRVMSTAQKWKAVGRLLTRALVIACSDGSEGGVAVLAWERGCLCQLALAAVWLLCFCVTRRRKEFPSLVVLTVEECQAPRGDSPGWLRAQRNPVKVFWGPRELGK